jgi:cytochrome c oxidase cbb3-type subunit 3
LNAPTGGRLRGVVLGRAAAALALLSMAACQSESRTLGPDQPQTAPNDAQDPRTSRYEDNLYQVSQGSRYFTWYGCAACHGAGAGGVRDLADGRWRRGGSVDRVYASIVGAHGRLRYGTRIPAEQLWQITAYVRGLKDIDPAKRQRQDIDQLGEAQGNMWSGPVR